MNSKHLLALYFVCTSLYSFGQTLVVNGGSFFSSPGSIALSNGGVWVNGGSVVELNGELTITKNSTSPEPGNLRIFTNGNVSNSGNLRIEQDLLCDGSLTNNLSTVEMYGNSNQIIGSNSLASLLFHDLTLSGTGPNNQKEMVNVDAQIDGSGNLTLNDRILNTHGQNMEVLNANPAAVSNVDLGSGFGFVASDVGGYFKWSVANANSYFAPLGSVNPSNLYRPVVFIPSGNDLFKMRLDQHDASVDGFPLANHNESICQANSKFYHRFISENGNSADFNVAYSPAIDGAWSGVAEYITQWEETGNNAALVNGGFSWLVVNSNSYVVDEEAFVLTNPGPIANFTFAAQDLFFNQVQFTDNSSGATQWSWDFNDGSFASQTNPFHVFSEGDFEVLLTVSNDFGCTDTATAWIHSGGALVIPNIFSPDNDGMNDLYEILLPSIEEYNLKIFNRWGSLLFESNNPLIQWNGDFEGVPCTEGTYFSILSIKQGNYQEQLEGTIQLVRKQQ